MKTNSPAAPHILVIDDNQAIHEDFKKILCTTTTGSQKLDDFEAAFFGPVTTEEEKAKFEIDSAFQGQEGLALIQKSLEEMGYKFPNGCSASSGEGGTRIQHYPSMLNRMERDLNLRCVSVTALDPAGQLIEKMKRAARTNPQPATVDSGN